MLITSKALPVARTTSVAAQVVSALKNAGIKYVFGVPGDTSLALYDALYDQTEEITHILARDERAASIMADVYARLTGEPGVCEAPSGAGAFYLVPGIAEANASSIPVLALTTDTPLACSGRNVLTEMDQPGLFAPVTKWRATLHHGNRARELIDKALRIATSGRCGAAQITLPEDVLEQVLEPPAHDRARGPAAQYPLHRSGPDPAQIDEIVSLLVAAKKPIIVAGGGVLISRAWHELTRLAELLCIPVATSINGKGSIDERHPMSLGVVGGNGARPYANALAAESDLFLFIGCKTDSVTTLKWSLPSPFGTAKVIQIDVDAAELGNTYPLSAGVAADAKLALAEIADAVQRGIAAEGPQRAGWQDFATLRQRWLDEQTMLAALPARPIRPQAAVHILQSLLPRNSVVVADAGSPTPLVSASYLSPPGRHVIIPRGYGGLGYAIPGVVAAKLARPDSPVIGLMGDGSFAMAAGSLETIARLNLPVLLIHFNNSCFGWIKALQHFNRNRRYFGVDFSPDTDYVGIAKSFGIDAIQITKSDDLRPVLTMALTCNRAMFIDLVCASEECATPPVHNWLHREGKTSEPSATARRV